MPERDFLASHQPASERRALSRVLVVIAKQFFPAWRAIPNSSSKAILPRIIYPGRSLRAGAHKNDNSGFRFTVILKPILNGIAVIGCLSVGNLAVTSHVRADPELGRASKMAILAGASNADAASRTKTLNALYARLLIPETDAESVGNLVTSIEKLWLESGSETVNVLMERALDATRNKNYGLGVKLLSAVVEIAPDYAEGWNQLAVAFYMSENYDQTLPPLLRALALEPRHFKAVEGYAILMREIGNKRAALAAFRRALQINPHLKSARDAEQELSREIEGQGI